MDKLKCPCCGSDFIDTDDCFNTEAYYNSVIRTYCGCCMDCGAVLTWQKVFTFSEYCNIKVDD